MLTLPQFIKDIIDEFKKNSFEIYIVGGAIRNLLLNKEVKNWDMATSAAPEDILKILPNSFVNNQYGTVSYPLKIKRQIIILEITPFRKEGQYQDFRHPEKIEWVKTIEEDLARRDFTINAIAYDGKNLIDPFGGQNDLKNKIIKAVGDPNKRFQEDALRLIRAIRFSSQLGFLIEEKTFQSIKKNAYLIQRISWERIRDEFLKILSSDHSAEGIIFLRSTGLLRHLLPELDICFSIPQKSPKRHHIYDVGTHSVLSLKLCPSKDTITRFATLIHDVGKALTFKKDEKTGLITFYNHEVVGEKLAKKIAERFRLSNKEKVKLITLVRNHQFSVSEIQTDKAIRRFIKKVGKDYLQDIIDLRVGDRLGSGAKATSWRFELFKKRLKEVQKKPFSISDLKINGHDVMAILNLKPGPKVGQVLKKIFEQVVENKLPNQRKTLLEEIKKFIPD